MADGLTRLLAPVLPVTADELWRHLPGKRTASVHMDVFPDRHDVAALVDDELAQRWGRLTDLRERVLAEIEPLRKDKKIGSSLQARVVLSASPGDLAFLNQHAAQLPMLFIVSEVELRPADGTQAAEGSPHISIERAAGVKCERCWRYVPAVSDDPDWAGLCDRCKSALAQPA
jgi:isoleucyl-tRNA synthetase